MFWCCHIVFASCDLFDTPPARAFLEATRWSCFMEPRTAFSSFDLALAALSPEPTPFNRAMGLANHRHTTRIKSNRYASSFQLMTSEVLLKDTHLLAARAAAAAAAGPKLSMRTADSQSYRAACLIGHRIDLKAERPKYDPEAPGMQRPAGFKRAGFDARKAAAAARHLARMAAGRKARGL